MQRKDIHPADITAIIKKSGRTLRSLSIELGYGDTRVSNCINTPRLSLTVLKKVAATLGRSHASLWPSCFHPNGRARTLRKNAPLRVCRNRTGAAA